MTKPDFRDIAREWLVLYKGHASPSHEQSLAAEFEKVFEAGRAYERSRVNDELQALVDAKEKS
jgi:hypothetical protein